MIDEEDYYDALADVLRLRAHLATMVGVAGDLQSIIGLEISQGRADGLTWATHARVRAIDVLHETRPGKKK